MKEDFGRRREEKNKKEFLGGLKDVKTLESIYSPFLLPLPLSSSFSFYTI